MNFGTWQIAVALITGIIAKEAVVSSMSLFYAGTSAALAFPSALSAFSFLVFVLLYVPCIAAVSTMKKELGGWKWVIGSVGWQMLVAYVMSFLVYEIGSLFV
jgi:ferrous iron transport protein B